MKVLVATKQTQGTRRGDLFLADEGELLRAPVYSREGPQAANPFGALPVPFIGVLSNRGTTTFKLAEAGIDARRLSDLLVNSYLESGWDGDVAQEMTRESLRLAEEAADQYAVGQVLERSGNVFRNRVAMRSAA
jgi:hypothetical protein